MNYHFLVGNDNGNSEHDICVDGELIQQPNINVITNNLPFEEGDIPVATQVKDLYKNLVVSINSPACKTRMYKVGAFALGESTVNYMQVGVDRKWDVDLPIVNTLGIISAYAVKKAFEKSKELPEKINVTVDMATALPVTQWSDEAATKFQKKFMSGLHNVIVHVGLNRVTVELKFEFVKVVPEGTPVIFALKTLPVSVFSEFKKMYGKDITEEINGAYFSGMRILHTDVGDGTTEYPITEGNRFLKQYIKGAGSDNGAGHAIEKALPEFRERAKLLDIPRQYMEEVLKGTDKYKAKYLQYAKDAIAAPLENQAMQIVKKVTDQINNIKNEIDLICCYGGGSILMRDYLFDKLKALADERGVKLLYIPTTYAVKLNALGLDNFVRGEIFNTLKGKALVASQTQTKGE